MSSPDKASSWKEVLLHWLRSAHPESALWRSTLMFVALDVFFTGLVGAYAYTHASVPGVLAFIMVQQLCTTAGHAVSNRLMQQTWCSPLRAQRVGVAGLAMTLVAAGSVSAPAWALLGLLCGAGGLARGVTYGARLWMEAQLKDAGVRQRYLSWVEASSTLFKVVVPAWAWLVLTMTPRFETIFLSGGVLFLVILAVTRAASTPFKAPGPYDVLQLWRQKAYWSSAPYFLVEGASHALRSALFVSGAMTVVGSVKGYALVEVCASLLAAGWLIAQGRIAVPGPSLSRLRQFLAMLALAWACLLGALWSPALLPVFVVLYALSMPLVSAQKAGVTLGGMVKAQGLLESHLMARSVLLMLARVSILAVFGVAYLAGAQPRELLVTMAATAIAMLPLEYWTARRLHHAAPLSPPSAG